MDAVRDALQRRFAVGATLDELAEGGRSTRRLGRRTRPLATTTPAPEDPDYYKVAVNVPAMSIDFLGGAREAKGALRVDARALAGEPLPDSAGVYTVQGVCTPTEAERSYFWREPRLLLFPRPMTHECFAQEGPNTTGQQVAQALPLLNLQLAQQGKGGVSIAPWFGVIMPPRSLSWYTPQGKLGAQHKLFNSGNHRSLFHIPGGCLFAEFRLSGLQQLLHIIVSRG